MERRDSTIELSNDMVDQNGMARFSFDEDGWAMPMQEDSEIAPWVEQDVPPTPPPKPTPIGPQLPPPPSRKFGSSFSSLVPTSFLGRSNGGSTNTLAVHDDSESFKTLSYSGSSTHSRELRTRKSSSKLLAKLKPQASKTHLRSDSSDSEHPSLRHPVPPLPPPHNNPIFNASTPTIVSIPATISKAKRSLTKKKSSYGKDLAPPPVPPKDTFGFDFDTTSGLVDFSHDEVRDIVDLSKSSIGSESSNGAHESSSFDSQPTFINPFPSASSHDGYEWSVVRKTSNPLPPHILGQDSAGLDGPASSVMSSWPVPPSWSVVEKRSNGSASINTFDISDDSSSDSDVVVTDGPKRYEDQRTRTSNTASASFSSMSRTSRGTLHDLPIHNSANAMYQIRIYMPDKTFQLASISLETTVAQLTATVLRDIEKKKKEGRPHPSETVEGGIQLYVKEQKRERMLTPNEKPAVLVKLRMEQAGYTVDDGIRLLGPENLGILVRFIYKDQLLTTGAEFNFDNYEIVNLMGRSLRTIPPIVHQNAEHIVSLRLSRNPMLEIPLDFIQSCTTLRELRLTHMYMKQVPESVRHCTTLHRLDISSNAIRDLEDTTLHLIPDFFHLHAQNNRLSTLPLHFALLKSLKRINVSNNKFRFFPIVLTQIPTLEELDISFNMITELPGQIGRLTLLKRFIFVGNQLGRFPEEVVNLVNLEVLDVRRNNVTDLSLVCRLPKMQSLSADHNYVRALDLSLGPCMKTLVASHNDITQLSLAPGPMGALPYTLTLLDISYAKLSSIDDLALGQLSSLRTLKLDHNSIRSIPDSLGDLRWLEVLLCADNKLDSLPSTIGKLQKLETLDAHHNNINELPPTLWNCASLMIINVTSNFLSSWPDLPASAVQQLSDDDDDDDDDDGATIPSLAHALEKLYIGKNLLTETAILPLMIFEQLQVLNLCYNELHDLPMNFFHKMVYLRELYLSGNKLTSIPVEDLSRLKRLSTLFLNGNKLQTLPQELGNVKTLRVLDVGSNLLKYNINNWEFDWNWNFNKNLKYLNLSGNHRLQIKGDPGPQSHRISRYAPNHSPSMLSGFKDLSQLKVLGLMDVTITTTTHDTAVDIPDETIDRRVRTSLSTVCNMGYGIADSLGDNETLMMRDLVHEFPEREHEAVFAMFGRTHPSPSIQLSAAKGSPNIITKTLYEDFVKVLKNQLSVVDKLAAQPDFPAHLHKESIPLALTWTFLNLNQDLAMKFMSSAPRKDSMTSTSSAIEMQHYRTDVAGVAVYFSGRTLYAANVGDALAVVSRQGVCQHISRKHDPFDRLETARIRAAEGFISPAGLVNDEVEVSRAFGCYHLFPPINARPDVFVYELSELDEFIIIANRGLWDFIPYQTAVDITRDVARTQRPDPMLAAQKLRDFAISYGADGSTMVMVIWVADLNTPAPDPLLDYRRFRKPEVRDVEMIHLENEISPPTGHVTLAFTDIRNSTHLWEVNPGMTTAMRLHNTLLRRQLRFCGGYEVKTEGDSFMCSFPSSLAAVWWCLTVQLQLLHEPWPLEILECEDGKETYDADNQLIARGLSVRMGIHSGNPLCEPDLITKRMDYFGPMVNRSARIQSSALGGQIACSQEIIRDINIHVLGTEELSEFHKPQSLVSVEGIRKLGVVAKSMGEVKLKGIELPENLYILYPRELEGRHDLKEAAAEPTVSGSRVHFSASQLQELGMLCLRIEALSSGRRFTPISNSRKASIVSNTALPPPADGYKRRMRAAEAQEDGDVGLVNGDADGEVDGEADELESLMFYSDPSLLLPAISEQSSDMELLCALDSLSLRVANAAETLRTRHLLDPPKPPSPKESLLDKLKQDGGLDEATLDYIASVLARQ
ncbi:hypothetical protein BDN70DRAFT_938582 [Pholiota conissans]|uniref:Adenylate cyclase n=1 Tax=Pholiota conissans TaxID=109636 RepID=A0A9P5YLA4_9AGAR|nr:hypothetical protein BDN70DRAFT_938582 [Pholiota conissans]